MNTTLITYPKWGSLSVARRAAWQVVGGLSNPSKMLGYSFGLHPQDTCKVGMKLRNVKGSTCSGCYALKGSYTQYPDVARAQARRLALLPASDDINHPDWQRWIDAMVHAIPMGNGSNSKYFRWHDAGDVHRAVYGEAIIEVARRRPGTQYWIPSREAKLWGALKALHTALGTWPANLCVRISASMVNGKALNVQGLPTSLVHTDEAQDGAYHCPAPKQGGKCDGSKDGGKFCNACFNPSVKSVSYGIH